MTLVQTGIGNDSATTATVTFPAAPTAGNVLVAVVANKNGNVSQAPAAGWTQAASSPVPAEGVNLGVYTRVCDGTEPTAMQVCTLGVQQSYMVLAHERDDITDTLTASAVEPVPAGSTTITIANGGNPGDYVALFVGLRDGTPSGYTSSWDVAAHNVDDPFLAMAYAFTSDTDGTISWTGAANGAAALVALESSGGAPTTPPQGQASGFLGFTATATGARASRGGFTDTLTHTGATDTHRASQGAFAGALAWLGQVTGRRRSTGTASGTLDHTGTATGDAPVVGSASGTFGGGITWGAAATGRRRSTGTGSGALTRTATTTGGRTSRSGVAGLLTWLGGFAGIGGNVPARDLTILEATLPTSEWATEQSTGAWATTPTENRWTHTTPTSSWTTTGATP